MEALHLVDHAVLLLLLLAKPLDGVISFRRHIAKLGTPQASTPADLYRATIIEQWVALLVLAVIWYLFSRPISDLGFKPPGGSGFYVGVGLLVLAVAVLTYAWYSVKQMSADTKAEQIAGLGDLVHFLPRSAKDHRYFNVTSLTAGIVEEIFYRGYLIWYFSQLAPLWVAVLLASTVFGVGHAYQGAAGIVKTGLVGLGFAGLYVLTDSIWVPIAGHILWDLLQGRTMKELMSGN